MFLPRCADIPHPDPHRTDCAAVNLTELVHNHKEDILANHRGDSIMGPAADSQGRGTLPGVNAGQDLTVHSQIAPNL